MLPGCIRVPTYKKKSLDIFKNNCSYRHGEKGVVASVKQLNEAEKNYLFDGRIPLLNEAEIIYVSIYNLSDSHYILGPEMISLEQMPFCDIKKAIKKTNSVERLFGAGVSSVGAYAALGVAVSVTKQGIAGVGTAPMLLLCFIGSVGYAISAVVIPLGLTFLAQGIKSIVMNARMHEDLQEKMLQKNVVIKSGEKYEGLIFVKSSDYKPEFTLTVHEKNKAKNSLTFDVDLGKLI